MSKGLSHIEFYFPDGEFTDRETLAGAIVDAVEVNDSLDYCGHAEKSGLKDSITSSSGNSAPTNHRPITKEEKTEIREVITETIVECNEALPVPAKNFVFVYPYFPGPEDGIFNGTMGLTTYSHGFHLFVDLSGYPRQSLVDTTAHELNHTIYYYHHQERIGNFCLLEHLLIEGLAENFKEEYINPETAPWAGALEKDRALEIFADSRELMDSKNRKEIEAFVFGEAEDQPRWMGYSVGYWLVQEFRAQHPDMSWDELMRLGSTEFIQKLDI